MNADCQRYAENPEANLAHLRDCLACRELYALLDSRIESKAVNVDALIRNAVKVNGADTIPSPVR